MIPYCLGGGQHSKERLKMKILIVDDESTVRLAIRMSLRFLGLTNFLEASSCEEGVMAFANNEVDLVITDYSFGKGRLTGFDLIKAIRNRSLSVSILLISAHYEEGVGSAFAVEALDIGASALIPKPFRLQQLRTSVADLLPNAVIEPIVAL